MAGCATYTNQLQNAGKVRDEMTKYQVVQVMGVEPLRVSREEAEGFIMTQGPELFDVWEYCATNKDAGTSTFFRLTFRDEIFRKGILWKFTYMQRSAKDGQGGIIDCADERAHDPARAPVASSRTEPDKKAEPDKKRRTRRSGRAGNIGAAMSVGAGAMSESIGRDSYTPPPGSNSTRCSPDGLGGYRCTSGSLGNESTTHCYPDGLGGVVCQEGY